MKIHLLNRSSSNFSMYSLSQSKCGWLYVIHGPFTAYYYYSQTLCVYIYSILYIKPFIVTHCNTLNTRGKPQQFSSPFNKFSTLQNLLRYKRRILLSSAQPYHICMSCIRWKDIKRRRLYSVAALCMYSVGYIREYLQLL